jgi:broad specificity phosphatase PhoE
MISVYFIRHAESEGNVNHHVIGGQSNHLPLTARGIEQAQALGERLAREGLMFQQIHSSVAIRAISTARIATAPLGISAETIQQTPAILEVSQGNWEGQLRTDIYTPERRAEMDAAPLDFKAPGGGESIREVQQRMYQWLEAMVAPFDPKLDVTLAAFTHGFALRSLLMQILGADPRMARRTVTHNTSITVVQRDHKGWLIERINDAAHLAGMDMIGHY